MAFSVLKIVMGFGDSFDRNTDLLTYQFWMTNTHTQRKLAAP